MTEYIKLWQNKKSFFIVILFLFSLTSLYAVKTFYKISNYKQVKVLRVSAKVIQISHSYGIAYITDEMLSDAEKKLLASEIVEYHRLKNIQALNIEKNQKNQTQELENLINKLPQMTLKELLTWSKKRVGVYFNYKKFSTRLNSVFYYASNRAAFQKALEVRLTVLYNEYLEKLSKKLYNTTPDTIDMECQKLFGIKYSNRNFRQKLKQKLNYATNFDSFFSSIDKSIEIYHEKRRKEEEERRRRQEQEERQRLNSMYQNILQEFVNLANYARSQNTLSDNALRSLSQFRERAKHLQERASLSKAQRHFLESLHTAGEWADLYFENLRLANVFTNIHKFNNAEQCINEARNARYHATKMLAVTIHAYNAL